MWRVPYLSANLKFFPVIGRFLCSMLEIVMRWHGDKKTYDKVFLFCCCICLSCHVIHLKFSNFFICYHLSFQSLLVSQTWPLVCTRSLIYVHKQTLIGKTFSLECVVILHIVWLFSERSGCIVVRIQLNTRWLLSRPRKTKSWLTCCI